MTFWTAAVAAMRFAVGPAANLYRARDGRADTLVGGPGRDSAQIDSRLDRTSGIERRLP